MNYALLWIGGTSTDSGGHVLIEHLASRKQLTPALAPICLRGGICTFLPLLDSTEEKRRKRLSLKLSSYLSGFGRRFYVGDPVTSGQVLRLPGLHCPGW